MGTRTLTFRTVTHWQSAESSLTEYDNFIYITNVLNKEFPSLKKKSWSDKIKFAKLKTKVFKYKSYLRADEYKSPCW